MTFFQIVCGVLETQKLKFMRLCGKHDDSSDGTGSMHSRSSNGLPSDPKFAADLRKLGYTLNSKGQFVSITNSTSAPYHISPNERKSERFREELHGCAREVVAQQMATLGVMELYLSGTGAKITGNKPKEAHLKFMATNPQLLLDKRDVVVIVGEHTQDIAIWAYRHLMKEGGVNGGSAVGLMKKLKALGLGGGSVSGDPSATPPNTFRNSVYSATDDGVDTNNRVLDWLDSDDASIPGIIILNPGQLLYSPESNECMTVKSWIARSKKNAIAEQCQIDDHYNRVKGHKTPFEHVQTMFDLVIPNLVKMQDARLWVVGIVDGAEHFINYMDAKMTENRDAEIGRAVSGMVLMEPTHAAEDINSNALKTYMAKHAKSWIKSSKPKFNYLNSPGATNRIMTDSQLLDTDPKLSFDGNESASEDGNESTAGKPPVSLKNSKKALEPLTEEPEPDDEAIAGTAPVLIAKAGNEGEWFKSGSPHGTSPPPNAEVLSLKSDYSATHMLQLPHPKTKKEDKFDDFDTKSIDSHDPYVTKVSCHTYSAGTDVDEMVFPEVMDAALDFFKMLADRDRQQAVQLDLVDMRAKGLPAGPKSAGALVDQMEASALEGSEDEQDAENGEIGVAL